MAKLYVIGDKKTGVLFLKTDPLRSVIIPSSAIRAYARAEKVSFDEAFGRVGSVARFLTNKGAKSPRYPDSSPLFKAVGDLIAGGETLSDVDFSFAADLSPAASRGFSASRFSSARFSSARFSSARFSSARFSAAPIGDAIALLDSSAGAPGDSIPTVSFDARKAARTPAAKAKKAAARRPAARKR
jgi:hypothetical protein